MHRIKASFSLGRKLRLRRAFTILSYLQKKTFEPHLLHRKQLKSPNKPPRVTQTQGSSTGPLLSEQLCLAGPPGPWAPVPSPCWIWGLRPLLAQSQSCAGACRAHFPLLARSVGTNQPALEELGLGRWLVTKNKCLQVNTVSSAGIK